MSAEIVRLESVTAPHERRKTLRLIAWLVAFATLPQLAVLPLVPYGVPVNVGGLLLDSSVLELVIGLAIIGGVVAARKAKNAQGGRAPLIGAGWAIVVGIVGGVIVLIGIFTFTPMGGGSNPPPPGGANALGAQIAPSIDTTASYPGSPYTACTSLTLGKIGATGTAAGVIWAATDAVYNANSGGPLAGGVFLERDAVARTKSGATFNTATCFQMAFSFQYTPSPVNTVGQTFAAPVLLSIQSVSYSILAYNNGTLINYPVLTQQPLVNGAQQWSILALTDASTWIPACPASGNVQPFSAGSCVPQQVATNDGTAADTIKLSVIVNINGPFSYDLGTSPVGKQWTLNFALGLPAGSAGAQNNYLNWVPYQLVVQATS